MKAVSHLFVRLDGAEERKENVGVVLAGKDNAGLYFRSQTTFLQAWTVEPCFPPVFHLNPESFGLWPS